MAGDALSTANESAAQLAAAMEAADAARQLALAAEAAAANAKTTADAAAGEVIVHRGDTSDPHAIEVLAVVDAYVRDRLVRRAAADSGAASWVDDLLSVADRQAGGRIDLHLSTEYGSGGEKTVVSSGESLWEIAARVLGEQEYGDECGNAPEPPLRSEQIIDYIARLWIANVGVVGANPDAVEAGVTLQLVCPGSLPTGGN
ncbi:MAG: hypothetical protein OEM97_10780 [Acidimicrobiia bacterium]|nr:hypothetical protein [Acidimicrobiia bacterium]